MSAGEHLEHAIAAMAPLGIATGRWRIEFHVRDGVVERVVPVVWDNPPMRTAIGRRRMLELRDEAA